MKLTKLLSLTSLLLLLLSLYYLYYTTRTLSFSPADRGMSHYLFDDTHGPFTHKRGNSDISDVVFHKDSSISFTYTLGDSAQAPYAGISIVRDGMLNVDVTSYDAVQCRFAKTNLSSFLLQIKTFVDGYSHVGDDYRLRPVHLETVINKNGVATIPIKSMVTPDWWFVERRISPDSMPPKPDFSKVQHVIISSSAYQSNNVEYKVHLLSLKFIRSKKPLYLSGGLWILSLMALLFIHFRKSKKKQTAQSVHYTPLAVSDSVTEELKSIIQYIGEQFSETGLTIEDVSKAVGIPSRKIATLFKEQRGETFKKYLHSVRLEEAKRLIMESDRRVTEIAYLVGYNYPSHFNTLFSERFNQTPTQMRKEQGNSSKP